MELMNWPRCGPDTMGKELTQLASELYHINRERGEDDKHLKQRLIYAMRMSSIPPCTWRERLVIWLYDNGMPALSRLVCPRTYLCVAPLWFKH
jgi:hypothetical protein